MDSGSQALSSRSRRASSDSPGRRAPARGRHIRVARRRPAARGLDGPQSNDAGIARSAQAGGRVALLLGSEGPGLSEEVFARVDTQLRIPMTERVDSLNVAAAAAIACYVLAAGNAD